ncbi:MAG: hypothetical protein IAB19_10475 [Proteobacteria bacterium]|uniref:FlgO domain-containing protein n=1 Tax=Candidatus Avisuccinivibrio stercorigallinarum TaxID=2840704 RepID=A0A9D9DBQ1_9GAMM|nr:hypothetical protein [Candidatus Avisuccinivibrio stercorigallinarum]
MHRTLISILAAAAVALTGCSSGNLLQDPAVYSQRGMEISRIAAGMTDTLYNTMYENLAWQKVAEGETASRDRVKNVTMPRVAVTSFVDTDTYEQAGHLGRVLGEIFIHELNLRQVNVLEYKLTGSLAVGKNGEYVYSRDYKKLAQTANISHLLTGTISRNEDGVVLVARIVNLQDHLVLGSATGFIPYSLLPYCYQTKEKGCSLGDVSEYNYASASKSGSAGSSTARAGSAASAASSASSGSGASNSAYRSGSSLTAGSAASDGRVYPPTSEGTYPELKAEQDGVMPNLFGGVDDSVIYPAQSYLDNNRPVRDIRDVSQYQRLEH